MTPIPKSASIVIPTTKLLMQEPTRCLVAGGHHCCHFLSLNLPQLLFAELTSTMKIKIMHSHPCLQPVSPFTIRGNNLFAGVWSRHYVALRRTTPQ